MEYPNGQPLAGRAPQGAQGASPAANSRRQVTAPRIIADLAGEQPPVDPWVHPTTVKVDTYAGPVRVEWDAQGAATTLGHVVFFVEYLKTAGLFDAWVADCPLAYRSPNSPARRDVLGTVLLSVLCGHWRYAHMTALRGDAVLAELLGMNGVVSEDAVRRGLGKRPKLQPCYSGR